MPDDELEHLRKILVEANRSPKQGIVARFMDRVKKKMARPINPPKSQRKMAKNKARRRPAA